jgi:hypothetical protein
MAASKKSIRAWLKRKQVFGTSALGLDETLGWRTITADVQVVNRLIAARRAIVRNRIQQMGLININDHSCPRQYSDSYKWKHLVCVYRAQRVYGSDTDRRPHPNTSTIKKRVRAQSRYSHPTTRKFGKVLTAEIKTEEKRTLPEEGIWVHRR